MNRFVIAEPKRGIGCNTCMAACTQVRRQHGLQTHPRLTVERDAQGTAPVLCRHCEDAPCAQVCPFGAITPSGSKPLAVPQTFAHHIPVQALTDVPVSVASINPFLSWNAGVKSVAVKCDLCAFQDKPDCVRVCPTQALFVADESHIAAATEAKRRQAMMWPQGNQPFAATEWAPKS